MEVQSCAGGMNPNEDYGAFFCGRQSRQYAHLDQHVCVYARIDFQRRVTSNGVGMTEMFVWNHVQRHVSNLGSMLHLPLRFVVLTTLPCGALPAEKHPRQLVSDCIASKQGSSAGRDNNDSNGAAIVALFAVIDVETTGLSAAQGDRVVEIAVVILDEQFRVVRMFDSLVHPQRSIPSQVTQIHGISNQAVRVAPTFADLLPDLMDCFSGSTHLVAHNISFDLGFLQAELLECGVQMPRSFGRLCTMQIARRKRVARDAKLSTVAAALRIPTIANAHRAIVDAGITARVLSLLHAEDTSVTPDPICWPNRQPSSGYHRQFPRHNPPISKQTLAHFGLTIASETAIPLG